MGKIDCVVVGAGVIGLAVAAKLAQLGKEVIVLEQHKVIGSETSSRNSEVIHAGIYYPAGSLKAKLCVRGKILLYEHCKDFGIPHRRCGKLIVANSEKQRIEVQSFFGRGKTNGVTDLRWIDESELNELEPNVAGMGALLSPSTGIIDSHQYMLSLQGILESNSGLIAFDSYVKHIEEKRGDSKFTRVYTDSMTLEAKWVINAGGLHAPNLASGMEGVPEAKYAIGHYYSYSGAQPFSHLIYPMPEDGGLGVHVTLDMGGQIKFGPDVRWINSIDYQFDDSRREAFVEAIRSYFPGLEEMRLQPSYTGIRPKISGPGEAADFLIHTPVDHGVPGRINLLGIESPGLTSSLAIAEAVSDVVLGEI